MKKIFLIIFIFGLAVAASAQSLQRVSQAEAARMIAAINSATASIKTIECRFSQEKTVSLLKDKIVSTGTMHYASTGKLRWEYISPFSYIFVINHGKVITKAGKKKSSIDVASSKLFQNITRIMVATVTGKGLSNSRDYTVTMYKDRDAWVAHLVPRDSSMKKMFKYIRLHLNPSHSMISSVEMVENSGDATIIKLYDIKTNKQIGDKVFTVN